ncbi:MAG: DUF1573 domain-containing protein [Bacteroidales bacterium]
MSQRVSLFFIILFSFLLSACTNSGLIIVNDTDLELGNYTDNNRVSFNVSICNNSSSPIKIDSITTSVSYLTSAYRTMEQINPGDTLHIPMLLFTQSLKGDVIAQISIFHSNTTKPLKQLVKAAITPTPADIADICTVPFGPLLIERNLVSMGDILVGKSKSDSILVYNPTDRAVNVTLPRAYGNATATMSSSIINSKKADYLVVTANYDNESDIGKRIFHTFRFNFDRGLTSDASIFLQGDLSEDFSSLTSEQLMQAPRIEIDSTTFDFGSISEGEEINHTFRLKNVGKRTLKIRSHSSSCDCTLLKLKTDSVGPGEFIDLTLYFNSKGKFGDQQRQIVIKTNDPNRSRLELWLTGKVK